MGEEKLTNRELFQHLENFKLDDPEAQFPFSKRLARDVGWSHLYALRVCDEYKKFVYLAMIAPQAITPSEEVDQAWHLHLTYTRSYWEEMCGSVLQKPFHHGPTKGGEQEDVRYSEQYQATLDLYRKEFDAEPPEDIWPPPDVRFARIRYVMVAPELLNISSQQEFWPMFGQVLLGFLAFSACAIGGLSIANSALTGGIVVGICLMLTWRSLDWGRRSQYPSKPIAVKKSKDAGGCGGSAASCGGGGCGSSGCGGN